MNKNVLILGNYRDMQTALYLLHSFKYFGKTTVIDTRKITEDLGFERGQQVILKEVASCANEFDMFLVLKGGELSKETLLELKKDYPDKKLVNWFFDKYFRTKPIYDDKELFDYFRIYDKFFCSLKGVADKLKEAGLENVEYLPEACNPDFNKAIYMNNFQKKKYGADISFCGTVGLLPHHKSRISILDRVVQEGFEIKIYGNLVNEKIIPPTIKERFTGIPAINEQHSMVCQSSLINLGIDQDPNLSLSQSARMFRVMCAGGLYLTTYVKDLETMFKINEKGKPITEDLELVVYYDEEDLIKTLDFLLSHDNIRKKIAENGKKVVYERHTFALRVNQMLEIVYGG